MSNVPLFAIHVETPVAILRRNEPVTIGVPFPRSVVTDASALRLVDSSGCPVPLQAQILGRWSDGSVRWVLLDFQVSTTARASTYHLTLGDGTIPAPAPSSLVVRRDGHGVAVDTGTCNVWLSPKESSPLSARLDACAARADMSFEVQDQAGTALDVLFTRCEAELSGPIRSLVRCDGVARNDNGTVLQLCLRVHFFAGLPVVRCEFMVRNPRPAVHPGNYWELGDAGSTLLQEVACGIRYEGMQATRFVIIPEIGLPPRESTAALELRQESSGGENWASRVHVDRTGKVPLRFRGYVIDGGGPPQEGRRAAPIAVADGDCGQVAVAMPHFWQNFPKTVATGPDGVTLGLFPAKCANAHEIQGGEQKTHVFGVCFGVDPVTEIPLDWVRLPLTTHLDAESYCASGVVAHLVPAPSDSNVGYLQLVGAALDGEGAFVAKRERIDEYGWRHFGDLYGDHEASGSASGATLVSHYNNQYDVVAGLLYHFMRTGNTRWFALGDEMAAHVADIDIYHTDGDKTAYNHGFFWHTAHYCDAGRSTHRSYPRAEGVPGGGPSNEHNYSTGLLLHHYLTGSMASREAVLELARWTLDMEDGTRTVFKWLARGDTGLSSQTGETTYHGPGRGAANSIQTLLDAHELTGDWRFLDRAEVLVRRCIHPADDIEARELRDPERRWFYTVFLQALGRYLQHKAELGQMDFMYDWARESLLHYARWAAEHEYPYLDKPGILEYPNETWPAQDMRKAEVFNLAALQAGLDERPKFLSRGRFFFDYSVNTLLFMPTHVLARPTVLMLVNGFRQAWFDSEHASGRPFSPRAARDFGVPVPFVPQKKRGLARAKRLAAAAGATGLAAAGYLLWRVVAR